MAPDGLTPLDLTPYLLREVLLVTSDGLEYAGRLSEVTQGRAWLSPAGVVRLDRIARGITEPTEVAAARVRIAARQRPLYLATAAGLREVGEEAFAEQLLEEVGVAPGPDAAPRGPSPDGSLPGPLTRA